MKRLTLTPVDGTVTIERGYQPASHIYAPGSPYARGFWLPQIGPTAYLAWESAVAWSEDSPITVDLDLMAAGLGVNRSTLVHGLERLAAFQLAGASTEPDVLIVKPAAPALNRRQLERLTERCPTLAAQHDEFLVGAR